MSKFLAALDAGYWLEFSSNSEPKCPHCGHSACISHNEWYHLYEEGEHDVECPECDRPFVVSTYVSHSFSTDEQDDLEEPKS